MKILLANAPWHCLGDETQKKPGWLGIRGGSRWPHTIIYNGGSLISSSYLPFPFFLATAGALAKKNGLDAMVRDSIAMGETYDEFYGFIREYQPDILVLETSTPSLNNDLKIAAQVKQIRGNVIIIFTGIHFELEKEVFLNQHPVIDFIIYGEFEVPLNDLLMFLTGKREEPALAGISNLVFRQDGKVIKNNRGPLVDIRTLPWPGQDDLPYENYFDAVCGLARPQLQILTTRGCPYGCIFCVWPQLVYKGKSYRMRDVQDVVDEIQANFKKHPYQSFYVDDDTFNINRGHVLGFARELKKRGFHRIPWGAMCRADLMDEEILTTLKDSGLFSVKYGVESADQRIIDEIDKKLDLDKAYRMVELTRELGIKVHLTFTFGLPGDTPESIERTIELACQMPNDSAQFSIATPFPGTAMYDLYEQKGWLTSREWDDFDGSAHAVSRTERFTGEELREFLEIAQHRYAGSRARLAITSEKFNDSFAEALKKMVPRGADILLLQSAIYPLTAELAKRVLQLGYKPHLMLHERFVPHFQEIIPARRLHIFAHTGNFNFQLLKDFARAVSRRHHFAGAIIPCSNTNGAGYEEVEKVAHAATGKLLFKVTCNGQILFSK